MSCNNCGKRGHSAYQCKMPITSNGIIAYRKHPETKAIEYLMIRRKDTLGLMDFIRGKYSVNNKYYIMNMISQMTVQERAMLLEHTFDEVWEKIWDKPVAPPGLSVNKSPSYEFGESRYKTEEMVSREKFNQLKSGVYLNQRRVDVADASALANPLRKSECFSAGNVADASALANPLRKSECFSAGNVADAQASVNPPMNGIPMIQKPQPNMFVHASLPSFTMETMINECLTKWDEPEWGFPKGKRNYNESDIDCAMREFYEETGIKSRNMTFVINNLAPYEEIFMGSNYKSYKHRYFLMYVDYNTSVAEKMTDVDKFEVSKVEWKSFNECLGAIRHYNLEKKRILSNINIVLTSCTTTFA
jgi:ADP-ribose pyrophosphatase YjhB (NUDIX family)